VVAAAQVLRLLPDEPQCMLGLAEIHLSNNQFERAVSVLRTAVNVPPLTPHPTLPAVRRLHATMEWWTDRQRE